jgi:glycosyltransferase involved in cell wall biosynthesis
MPRGSHDQAIPEVCRVKAVVIGTRGFPNIQGGIESHCQALYPRLVKLGCDVTVFGRAPYLASGKKQFDWNGVHISPVGSVKIRSLETVLHTIAAIFKARKLRPDILHIHGIGPALWTPLAKLMGFKVVLTHHGPDYKRAKWGVFARCMLRLGEAAGVRFSDRTISISTDIKISLAERFRKDSTYIPNGVEIRPPVLPGKALSSRNLLPGKYIFTACRMVPEKGLHDLLAAYASLKNPRPDLVIAGDSDHESEYSRSLKAKAARTPGVVLTGIIFGEELAELYSNAALYVLPSYYEGLPIGLLEALSYKLPILASDIPPNRQIPLLPERYFPPGNIELFGNSLAALLRKGITPEEQERNIRYLEEHFSWDAIAEKTMEVYSELHVI